MFSKYDVTKILFTVLTFPLLFQGDLLSWCLGSSDYTFIMLFKRIFLLLPAAAVVGVCWVTIVALLTLVFRQKRREFAALLFVSWWDLGRAIASFWGGVVKFVFLAIGWVFTLLRICLLGLWYAIQDIVLSPLRTVKGMSQNAFRPGVPWIAVCLTVLWCLIEGLIFTFVMTDLVVDTLSGFSSVELNRFVVQIFLYCAMFAIAIGSFSILANLEGAVKTRNVKQLAVILSVELFSVFFEVVFLYREFVEALVPWFAQYSGGQLNIGVAGVIGIAVALWIGVRGLTWFLFAEHGTPTILAIIRRTGLDGTKATGAGGKMEVFPMVKAAVDRIKSDINWTHEKGDELLSAFVLPPLQIVAAVVNFLNALINSRYLFEIPFKSYKEVLATRDLIKKVSDN